MGFHRVHELSKPYYTWGKMKSKPGSLWVSLARGFVKGRIAFPVILLWRQELLSPAARHINRRSCGVAALSGYGMSRIEEVVL